MNWTWGRILRAGQGRPFHGSDKSRAGRWGPASAVQCAVTASPTWQSSQPGQVGEPSSPNFGVSAGVRLVNFFSCLIHARVLVFQPLAFPKIPTPGFRLSGLSDAPLPDSRMNSSISSSVETMVLERSRTRRGRLRACGFVPATAAICVCRSRQWRGRWAWSTTRKIRFPRARDIVPGLSPENPAHHRYQIDSCWRFNQMALRPKMPKPPALHARRWPGRPSAGSHRWGLPVQHLARAEQAGNGLGHEVPIKRLKGHPRRC